MKNYRTSNKSRYKTVLICSHPSKVRYDYSTCISGIVFNCSFIDFISYDVHCNRDMNKWLKKYIYMHTKSLVGTYVTLLFMTGGQFFFAFFFLSFSFSQQWLSTYSRIRGTFKSFEHIRFTIEWTYRGILIDFSPLNNYKNIYNWYEIHYENTIFLPIG